MGKDYVKDIKGVINADLFSGKMVERAKESAALPDKKYIGEIEIANRCKKGSHSKGRK
jgi:hypothetical protein